MTLKFVFFLLLAALASSRKHSKDSQKDSSDFVLPDPKKVVKENMGSVRAWKPEERAFDELGIKSEIIALKPDGLMLPMYLDADSLCYVLEGRATAGIVRPSGEATNTRYVRVGDAVALPAGWTVWLWNTGTLETKMLCVNKPVLEEDCRSCETFFLAGSEQGEKGSILHGFSDEVLQRIFEVDAEEARSIIEAQKSSVFADGKEYDRDARVDEFETQLDENGGDMELGEVSFGMETARPEMIEPGGRMTLLDDTKMKILKDLSFGAMLVKLNPSSMFAPQWILGSGQMIYITKGEGRVEVADYEGRDAVNQTVDAGTAIVIPPYHPHTVVNTGSSSMEWICIHFTSKFYPMFMAGSRSVYASIPLEILSASFNTSSDVADGIRTAHEREKMFFTLDHRVLSNVV